MKQFLTCTEVANRLGVHVGTVRGWVRAGMIPAHRLGGRFRRLDWDEVVGAMRRHRRKLRPADESSDVGVSDDAAR